MSESSSDSGRTFTHCCLHRHDMEHFRLFFLHVHLADAHLLVEQPHVSISVQMEGTGSKVVNKGQRDVSSSRICLRSLYRVAIFFISRAIFKNFLRHFLQFMIFINEIIIKREVARFARTKNRQLFLKHPSD